MDRQVAEHLQRTSEASPLLSVPDNSVCNENQENENPTSETEGIPKAYAKIERRENRLNLSSWLALQNSLDDIEVMRVESHLGSKLGEATVRDQGPILKSIEVKEKIKLPFEFDANKKPQLTQLQERLLVTLLAEASEEEFPSVLTERPLTPLNEYKENIQRFVKSDSEAAEVGELWLQHLRSSTSEGPSVSKSQGPVTYCTRGENEIYRRNPMVKRPLDTAKENLDYFIISPDKDSNEDYPVILLKKSKGPSERN